MKKKIELVCWILFTVFSGIGFFINFMSTPPVNDTHTFTLYMIGAAVVSLLYPASMFVHGTVSLYVHCRKHSCNDLFIFIPNSTWKL